MEPIEIIFLGTSAAMPTPERGLSSIALRFRGDVLLFDAGEGTQRQLMQSKVSYMKIARIFISHFHADHFLGLPGMLATMNMLERYEELHIYGPRGIKLRVQKALELALMKLTFQIHYHELKEGTLVEAEHYTVSAFPLKHSSVCWGFAFKEKDKQGTFQRAKAEALGIPVGPLYAKLQRGETVKVNGRTFKPKDVMDYSQGRDGRKVCVVMDTMPSETYVKHLKDSDVLIHESVFCEEESKRAKETKHSTARGAAEIAAKACVKKLYLTHISSRYKDTAQLVKEAREVFPETEVATDLLYIQI